MSAELESAVAALKEKFAGQSLDGTVKFDVEDEGVILVSGDEVKMEDGEADVTISASLDTFREMFDGNLSPTAAYMTGKIKIDGDMGTAMKLSQFL